jgi:ABC-type branched-subunit amino acid transport system permease subunit
LGSYIAFGLIGLGTGSIYAAIALGLIMVYRGSGVVNFAFGAMAMSSAYVYDALRTDGTLTLPIPGLPNYQFGGPLPFLPSLLIAMAWALVLGYISHLIITKALRNSTMLGKVLATVGIMGALQAAVTLRYGTNALEPPPIFPLKTVDLWGVVIPQDSFWLAGAVAASGIVFGLLFKLTRAGLAVRGAAESVEGAAYLGWSPDRLALMTWLAGSVLASVFAVLVAPITTLDPTKFTLLVVPAIGAALLARMQSFTVAIAAGLVIGIIESVLTEVGAQFNLLTQMEDIIYSLPFVIVVGALIIAGASLPRRGSLATLRMPRVPPAARGWWPPAVMTAVGVVLLVFLNGGWRYAVVSSMIMAILCLSLVVLTGFAGQISFAQMSFAGVAGFSLSKLAVSAGIPFPISPLIAAIAAGILGFIVAIPAMRVRGTNLAIATLGLAEAAQLLLFQNNSFSGGLNGATIPRPTFLGIDFGIEGSAGQFRLTFCFLVLAILLVAGLAVSNLRRSGTGRAMLAVRANERAAAACGIKVPSIKILAFTMSAFIAGIAGSLTAYQQSGGNLSFNSFTVFVSISILATAYIGGITSVSGAIVSGLLASGGLFFYGMSTWISSFGNYQLLLAGVGLVIVTMVNPGGIAADWLAMLRLLRRLASRASPPAPAPAATATEHGPAGSRAVVGSGRAEGTGDE